MGRYSKKKKKKPRRSGVFVGTYHDYLQSRQWAKKRRKALRHYGHKCATCGSGDNIHVHHRHYKTLFQESVLDLELLCAGCHANLHEQDEKCLDPLTAEFVNLVRSF